MKLNPVVPAADLPALGRDYGDEDLENFPTVVELSHRDEYGELLPFCPPAGPSAASSALLARATAHQRPSTACEQARGSSKAGLRRLRT